MRTIKHIIIKEFTQIKRNKVMLPMLSVMPIVQLILLSYAADFEIKHLKLAVLDNDMSIQSAQLINKFEASGYFETSFSSFSEQQALDEMEKDNADVILNIPREFSENLNTNTPVNVQVLINAVNNQKAGIAANYTQQVINLFNQELNEHVRSEIKPLSLNIKESYWYNPELNYKVYMVPGILAVLVSILTAFISGVNIVREREIGTIEQLNVSPIKKYEFLLGKLIPFWIIGMILLALGLTAAYLIFGITVAGSIWLLFGFGAIFLVTILGLGMFISTFANTQQQAMFTTWFFMILFILMSGLFTPVDAMPQWAKVINVINPLKYFVEVMRMIMLKGSGFAETYKIFGIIVFFAFAFNALAVYNYKKTA